MLYAVTVVAIVTVVFLLPRALPGSPLTALEDPSSGQFLRDAETRQRVLAHYGLDASLASQYRDYVTGLATGDFGWSIARKAPVAELLAAHLPWTLALAGTSLLLATTISFLAGIAAAWRRGRRTDRLLVGVLTWLRTVPEYVVATLLLIALAVLIPVFPLGGAQTPFTEHGSWLAAAADVAHHLALPVLALTISQLGGEFLLVRNTAVGVLGEDYLLLGRAKGVSDRRLRHRYVGRNAALPFLTVLGVRIAFAVGGAVFVEAVFAYPGMGTLILEAVETRDYPVLEATFLVLSLLVLVANLVVELVYGRLDPRTAAP